MPNTQPTDKGSMSDEFIEITEKYNRKGFLVERYYMKDGKQIDLPIPKFAQENPVVAFWNPNTAWAKQTKRLTKKEFNLCQPQNT